MAAIIQIQIKTQAQARSCKRQISNTVSSLGRSGANSCPSAESLSDVLVIVFAAGSAAMLGDLIDGFSFNLSLREVQVGR